jgi:predicted DNA-binding protein
MSEIGNTLAVLAALAASGVISWAAIRLGRAAKEWLTEIRNKPVVKSSPVLSGFFDLAIHTIETVAGATVGKLEQTVGKDLREKIKTGEATKEDLYRLADKALEEIVDIIEPDVLDKLSEYVGDTEAYIKNVIEAELLKLKKALYS